MHQVSIEAEYVSDLDYFDFDSDMEPMVVARAMAREGVARGGGRAHHFGH